MGPRVTGLVRGLRPAQWTKNGVVLAAFFFALGDWHQKVGWRGLVLALGATAIFCALSSAVYLLNDVRDAPMDRLHPVKRKRPVASGEVSAGLALWVSAGLLVVGLWAAWALSVGFWRVAAGYVLLQGAYTLGLKRVAGVDVMMIAAGFVLRAMAGAVALGVALSPWLLLCAFLLALFLALCKRRHEKRYVDNGVGEAGQRPALDGYELRTLDQWIVVTASATLVAYAIYTLWPATVEKFGSPALGFTVPFVVYGLFRYLDLVYRGDKGDQPERVLLTDIPLLIDLALYVATVLTVFALR